jgi:hypothetical protein
MLVLAGGSARCGASGAPRWSLPSATPGRPRGHCLAMPARYAPGHRVSVIFLYFLCPLSLAMLSDQLVQNSEPSSQILLCAAAWCKLDSVNCDCAITCDKLPAPLPPLSAHLLTEVLFWTLHICKIQLMLVIYLQCCTHSASSILWYARWFPYDFWYLHTVVTNWILLFC